MQCRDGGFFCDETAFGCAATETISRAGIFSDDHLAAGALWAFAACGLSVPEDVKVVSWANHGDAPNYLKQLTLMDMDPRAHGRSVAKCVLARLDVDFDFFISTLLCLGLNYARFMLKGGIFGRAITSTRVFAEMKELLAGFGDVPAEVGKRIRPLGRQISRNTEAVNHLSRRFFGVQKDTCRERKRSNDFLVKKASAEYYRLLRKGVSERFALTDACRAVEAKYGLGEYKNFVTFLNMVSRVVAKR